MGCNMQHKSCCDYKQLDLKLEIDQKAEQATKFISQANATSNIQSCLYIFHHVKAKKPVPEIFAPPPLQTPLYTFHCVYRI